MSLLPSAKNDACGTEYECDSGLIPLTGQTRLL